MSLFAEELGGYANDEGCPGCGQPRVPGLRSRCAACSGQTLERRTYTPSPDLVQRCALKLAGEKLRAYRQLTVMAINRSLMYTHRLDDRASEAAAGTAVLHAVVAAHNAFVLRPDLCPRRAQVAA